MAKKIPGAAKPAPAAPAAPAATTPNGLPVTARTRAAKQLIDRNQFKYAVWVGSGARPKFWANTLAEINTQLATLAPNRLNNVHVGEIKAAKTEVKVTV